MTEDDNERVAAVKEAQAWLQAFAAGEKEPDPDEDVEEYPGAHLLFDPDFIAMIEKYREEPACAALAASGRLRNA